MSLIRPFWRRREVRRVAAVCLTACLALTLSNHTARGMLGFAVANATGMLDARSPGERPDGALVQTKAARRHRATAPESRVLSEGRFKPGVPAEPDLSSDLPASAIPEGVGNPVPLADNPAARTGPGPLGAAAPAAPGGTPLVTTEQLTTPVPEPETYLLFALGIGVVGLVHRRRRIAAQGHADKESGRHAAE